MINILENIENKECCPYKSARWKGIIRWSSRQRNNVLDKAFEKNTLDEESYDIAY